MKTNIIISTLAIIIAAGTTLPATAATQDPRPAVIAADKPEVKILFRHTSTEPYDVRLLSWCGGMASRIEIVPYTTKTFVVAYNTGDLGGAKITGRAPSRIGFRFCKDGKTTILLDILSLDKKETLLPGLVIRRSNVAEWKFALDQQNSGQFNTKTFARTPMSHDFEQQDSSLLASR